MKHLKNYVNYVSASNETILDKPLTIPPNLSDNAHYLALAERENCEFWTADTRLFNAINGKLPWVHKLEEYQASS